MRATDEGRRVLTSMGPFVTQGIQLALGIVVLFFVGQWLDGKLGTTPWLMMLGLVIGAVGGLIKFVLTALRVGKEQDAQDNAGRTE